MDDVLGNLTRLLANYGPSGLLIVAAFPLERRIASRMSGATGDERRYWRRIDMGMWVAIVVLGLVVVLPFIRDLIRGKYVVASGVVYGLKPGQDFKVTHDDAYVRSRADLSRVAAPRTFYWLVYSARKFSTVHLEFFLDEDEPLSVPLQLADAAASDDINIHVSASARKVTLLNGVDGVEKQLWPDRMRQADTGGDPVARAAHREDTAFIRWPALAHAADAEPFSPELTLALLGSADRITRYEARSALAAVRPPPVDWISDQLDKPATAYRVKVGLLVALMRMPREDSLVSWKTATRIASWLGDSDETLRSNAAVYLRQHGGDFVGADGADLLRPELERLVEASSGEERDRLARGTLDIFYNRRIQLWLAEPDRALDDAFLEAAKGDLDAAWSFRSDVAAAEAPQFAKAQWGIGLLYHAAFFKNLEDRGQARPELKRVALQAFEMVAELPNDAAYEYPHHKAGAARCVAEFEEDCTEVDAVAG